MILYLNPIAGLSSDMLLGVLVVVAEASGIPVRQLAHRVARAKAPSGIRRRGRQFTYAALNASRTSEGRVWTR